MSASTPKVLKNQFNITKTIFDEKSVALIVPIRDRFGYVCSNGKMGAFCVHPPSNCRYHVPAMQNCTLEKKVTHCHSSGFEECHHHEFQFCHEEFCHDEDDEDEV